MYTYLSFSPCTSVYCTENNVNDKLSRIQTYQNNLEWDLITIDHKEKVKLPAKFIVIHDESSWEFVISPQLVINSENNLVNIIWKIAGTTNLKLPDILKSFRIYNYCLIIFPCEDNCVWDDCLRDVKLSLYEPCSNRSAFLELILQKK
jgi:hypothetical protein